MAKDDRPLWALGTMSGTSLDGVDAAMILTDGRRVHRFGPHAFRPYSADERAVLRQALGHWPGEPHVRRAAEVVEAAHAEILARFTGAEVIGFHGQTLAHDPHGRGTHQAGDGGLLARLLGVPVVWDFRTADVRLGGEGAPLAPFYHFALAQWMGATEPLAILNIGGVANVTWIDPRAAAPEADGALLAFDTGPGNALIDDLVHARLGLPFDRDGEVAASGQVAQAVVDDFLASAYFRRMPPKSLDRNGFPALAAAAGALSTADGAATLVVATVAGIAAAAEHFPAPVARLLVAGGGRHNPVIMRGLARACSCPVQPVEEAGIDGDMLEAAAFAHLAVRVMRGLPTSCHSTTGVAAAVGGGRISRPDAGP